MKIPAEVQSTGGKIEAPLRWAGSKRKLLKALTSNVPKSFSTYIEPFAGSACLFFHLQPEKAILGDINAELVNFYKASRNNSSKILRSALHFKRNETNYYSIRNRFLSEKNLEKRASLFLFLNRFCFNGIFRTNSTGGFNVPYGNRTGGFQTYSAFRDSSNLLKRAKLLCVDFDKVLQKATRFDFVYMDPPYVYKSRKDRGEYGNKSFSLKDICRLEKAVENLDRRNVRFLLSYIDCEEINKIKERFNYKVIPVARTVAGLSKARKIVNELLICNF